MQHDDVDEHTMHHWQRPLDHVPLHDLKNVEENSRFFFDSSSDDEDSGGAETSELYDRNNVTPAWFYEIMHQHAGPEAFASDHPHDEHMPNLQHARSQDDDIAHSQHETSHANHHAQPEIPPPLPPVNGLTDEEMQQFAAPHHFVHPHTSRPPWYTQVGARFFVQTEFCDCTGCNHNWGDKCVWCF